MLEEIFLESLKVNTGVRPGDRILIGVSGGKDSVALLHLFHKHREVLGVEPVVAHINHRLRGGESERDQDFVMELADRLGLKCFILREDVAAIARENKWSIEEAARKVRYEYMGQLLKEEGCSRIAVAHHRKDQAETVLMHLIRGSGIKGLGAMKYDSNQIIRPLLDASREQIDDYLARECLESREDESNTDPRYARNRIRLELLPLLETYNPEIEEALCRTARISGIENDYLEQKANVHYDQICQESKNSIEFDPGLENLHKALRNRLLIKAYGRLTGSSLEYRYLERIEAYLASEIVKKLGLPGQVSLYRYDGSIFLGRKTEETAGFTLLVEGPGSFNVGEQDLEIRILENFVEETDYVVRGSNEGFADYDKLVWPLSVRTRQPGDRFLVIHESKPRKLKRLLIDRKIRGERRGSLPLVVDALGRIVFIPGIGISEYFKIDSDSSKILYFSFR